MFIVPNFRQNSIAVVCSVFASSSGVESWSRAAKEWNATGLLEENVSHVGVGVRSEVGWNDTLVRKPFSSWEPLVVLDGRFEEINHVLVLSIQWSVARNVD